LTPHAHYLDAVRASRDGQRTRAHVASCTSSSSAFSSRRACGLAHELKRQVLARWRSLPENSASASQRRAHALCAVLDDISHPALPRPASPDTQLLCVHTDTGGLVVVKVFLIRQDAVPRRRDVDSALERLAQQTAALATPPLAQPHVAPAPRVHRTERAIYLMRCVCVQDVQY
jgi:hypothetical protein